MTISSMYRNEEVYTENMDEFIIPCYTIARKQKKTKYFGGLWNYGIIRAVEKQSIRRNSK